MKMVLNSDSATEQHVKEMKDLFKKYHPIELDPNLDREEKKRHMNDWFTQNLKMYTSMELTESDF